MAKTSKVPFRVLHFADTHNNRLATAAVVEVVSASPEACVAFTGDLCTYGNPIADPRLNQLPNPRVWIVPGEHDLPAAEAFAALKGICWRTPFVETRSRVKVVGLDTTAGHLIDQQLSSLRSRDERKGYSYVLILCHNPPLDRHLRQLLVWLSPPSHQVPIVLCHGHVHHDSSFYARSYILNMDGSEINVSHVYSANTGRNREFIGAGNLIEFCEGGALRIEAVSRFSLPGGLPRANP